MIADKNDAKSFVRLKRHRLKSRLNDFYVSTLESKLARTFTDDADLHRGLLTRRNDCLQDSVRPGQRDDESRRTFGNLLPV